MKIDYLKEKFKKGVIILAAINLVGFLGLTGVIDGPTLARAATDTITIDNGDAEYSSTGAWSNWVDPSGWLGDYQYEIDSTTVKTATWQPNITEPGDYQVYVHWSVHSARPTSVDYQINYASGVDTQSVDQTKDKNGNIVGDFQASGWKLLGTYDFNIGSSGFVQLTEIAAGDTCADAVRFFHSNALPSVPNLTSPANGSATNNQKPTFEWQASTDSDDPNDVSYQLQIDGIGQPLLDPTKTEYTPVANLVEGNHIWRVRSFDNESFSGWSQPNAFIVDTTPPTADANGKYYLKEGQQVQLNGSGSNDNFLGSGIASYNWSVKRPNNQWKTYTGQRPIIATYQRPGSYQVELMVRDRAGNPSVLPSYTTIEVSNLLPDAPVLSIARDDGIVTLSWNKVDDTRGYKIKRNGQYISDLLGPKTTSFVDYSAENGQTYKYRVVAFDMDPGYQSQFSQSNRQEIYIPRPQIKLISVAQAAEEKAPLEKGEVKAKEDQEKSKKIEGEDLDGIKEAAEEPKTNWPMIVAIIIAAVIVLGGAAYWWYGVSEDEDQI